MKNRKGFTLVEMLAVVVILGIIMMISIPAVTKWIDKSKSESKGAMKKTLVMASQSYAQANTDILPKSIGQTITIQASDLKESNYLKEELVDADKKSCMASYVKISKVNKKVYNYTAVITCEGDTIDVANSVDIPTISIGFSGNTSTDGKIHSVSATSFKAVIQAGASGGKSLTISGYSYMISVRYAGSGELVEIYNSGSIEGGRQDTIVIEKNLGDYTDITTATEFIVTVEAYNSDGGYFKQTRSSNYKDNTAPSCGTITGAAKNDEDYLTHKGNKRTISVACSDNEDGSGCLKDVFTQTFDTEMEYGTITISDNAGNTRDCTVRVNIDWTAPSFTAVAYKHTGNLNNVGEAVSDPLTVSQSTQNHTITMASNYKYTHNGWLNIANYPKGIAYVITTTDNIRLKDGKLYDNVGGVWSESNNQYDSLKLGQTKNFTAIDNSFRFSFDREGMRKAKYVVQDKAGNAVTMNFLANIDLTNPSCREMGRGNVGSTGGVSITLSCSDGESKCSSSNTLSYSGQKSNPSTYVVNDNAGNSGSCSVTISSYSCHCSDCYYGENTCSYGCDTCGGICRGISYWNGYQHSCEMSGYQYISSYSCNCDSCYYGHNTCRYGCDTCYR